MKKTNRILSIILTIVIVFTCCVPAFAESTQYLTRGDAVKQLLVVCDDYNPNVVKSDIIKGRATGSLDEDKPVTRTELLVMISRAFGTLPTPKGDNLRSASAITGFTDAPLWATSELDNVFKTGIVTWAEQGTYVTPQEFELLIERIYAIEANCLRDDFYATVNKTALDNSVILPGYTGSGSFNDLGIQTSENVSKIIEEIASGNVISNADKKIATLYSNICDTASRNSQGITPIKPYIDAVNSCTNLNELIKASNYIYENTTMSIFLGFGLTVDKYDSTKYSLTFSTTSASLGKTGYDSATDAQKAAYKKYLSTQYALVGLDKQTADKYTDLVWDFESDIAANSLSRQDYGDVDKTYNVYTLEQLQALFPNVDMNEQLTLGGFSKPDKIIVTDVGSMNCFATYFYDQHFETLKALALLYTAMGFGTLLNEDFQKASNTFSSEYYGVSGALSTEDLASQYVQSLMSDYLGEAYVERYFSKQAKTDVENIVNEIISVYKQRIQALDWMSEQTKQKAIKKLDTMKIHMGYPDKFDSYLDQVELKSTSQGGSFFENVITMAKLSKELSTSMQFKPVDKSSWIMSPYTVNACYNATTNTIEFPAGILQAPFYDVNASRSQNLGGIGYIIAHEITHAFDNNGAKYDENGNAADWWTPADYEQFSKLCDKVIAFYDGREIAPGITCNGELTLSENIADLGAVACITQLEGMSATPDYKTLYTSMAAIWCSSYTREFKQYLTMIDVHAPDKLRGGLTLANFEPFYEAFGIKEGDGMYIPKEQRVSIW